MDIEAPLMHNSHVRNQSKHTRWYRFSREVSRDRDRDKKRDQEDEEEAYERRKLERKLRDKEAAYQEVGDCSKHPPPAPASCSPSVTVWA